MKNPNILSVLTLLFLLFSGCATVYLTEDFDYFQASHKTVALAPYSVSINLKKLPKGLTEEDLKDQERDEAYLFQKQLYTRFMSQFGRGRYTVEFQDVDRTNILLKRAGIDYYNMSDYTKDELAHILGVDSIISGTISRSKPMTGGTAVFSTLLIGYSATNDVNINMNVHDGETGKLLWSYDHQVTRGLGSSAEGMAKELMNGIASSFPYRTEQKPETNANRRPRGL